ncbi:hypothetical protein Tco_1561121 [Tanacetum coccineum]
MICNMDSIGKYMLEIIPHQQQTPQLLKQKKLMQKQEDHSNQIQALNVDSLKVDLVIIQNTCSEKKDSNSETASSNSVKENDNTFTSTMFLNVDQLHKQLDKDEFQEDGSMATFWVINRQFPKFIDSKFSLDYDSQMTEKYFVEYTRIEIKQFKDTLLQHMGNVRKSVAERMCHHRQYDRRLNKRQMQMQKSKIDTGKAVDADLVITESSGTESEVQDNSSRSGNDTNADDADIRPIYDEDIRPIYNEEPMAEVQLTAECNIFGIGQQHTEQPGIINEGRVDQSKTIEQKTSLLANNADLKAQIQKKVFTIAALKNDIRKLKGVTQHYLPKRREYVFVKPDHMIASSESRNSSKNMPRFSSNDMVHNHYLDEARKKIQEEIGTQKLVSLNKTSVMYEKTSSRSDLRWKPTGRIFKIVGLRWVPTGKILASCTSKDDSESTHGSNVDIPNIHICKQTLDLSAGTSINVQKEQGFDLSAGTSNNVKQDNLRVWLLKKLIS